MDRTDVWPESASYQSGTRKEGKGAYFADHFSTYTHSHSLPM